MARVTVKITGFDNFTRQQTKIIKDLSNRQLEIIAKDTEDVIRQKIKQSIRRAGSTGNLADSFFAEKILAGWGIGNIQFLNQNAPYWRHVNFGSRAIGASHSHRVPQGAFAPGISRPTQNTTGGRWNVGGGNFSFIPTRPIAPLNYIAKTLAELNRIVAKGLREGK